MQRTIASGLVMSWMISLSACLPDEQAPGGPAPDAAIGQPLPDAGPGAADAAPPLPDAGPPLTVSGMIAAACPTAVCNPTLVVSYWKNAWDTYSIKRTVTFQDVSTTEQHLIVTDENGQPATLSFAAGLPVTLTIVNPGDATSTGKHDLTAPALFRAVAWRRVSSPMVEYHAAQFDAIHVRRRAPDPLTAVLQFVPMNGGTFDVYCQIGVPNGASYDAIVAGTVVPDLANPAGHAGKGAKTTSTITPITGYSISIPTNALGGDTRRLATDPVWAAAALDVRYRDAPLELYEFDDDEYGLIPGNLTASVNKGIVFRVTNPNASRTHAFATPTLYASSVIRQFQDENLQVESSTFTSPQIFFGNWVEVWALPTVQNTFAAYCDIGVKLNADGSPMLTTGHAGKGMVGTITVGP